MNVTCNPHSCPVILNSSCVFYEGEKLINSGINTNDSLQVVIKKLNDYSGSIVGIQNAHYFNTIPSNGFGSNGDFTYVIPDNKTSVTLYQKTLGIWVSIFSLPLTVINDSSTSLTETWSANKLNSLFNTIGDTYQLVSNLSTDLVNSYTKYPNVNAVNTGLALKADKTYVDTQLNLKENLSNKVNNLIASSTNYPTVNAVNTGLASKEDVANKATDLTSPNNIKYTTSQAVVNGLALKENTITATTSADYFRGDKTFAPLNKAAVGLSLVDNVADINKPVSTPQQTALNLKANLSSLVSPIQIAFGDAGLVGNQYTNIAYANQSVSIVYQNPTTVALGYGTFNSSGVLTLPVTPVSGFVAVLTGTTGTLANYLPKSLLVNNYLGGTGNVADAEDVKLNHDEIFTVEKTILSTSNISQGGWGASGVKVTSGGSLPLRIGSIAKTPTNGAGKIIVVVPPGYNISVTGYDSLAAFVFDSGWLTSNTLINISTYYYYTISIRLASDAAIDPSVLNSNFYFNLIAPKSKIELNTIAVSSLTSRVDKLYSMPLTILSTSNMEQGLYSAGNKSASNARIRTINAFDRGYSRAVINWPVGYNVAYQTYNSSDVFNYDSGWITNSNSVEITTGDKFVINVRKPDNSDFTTSVLTSAFNVVLDKIEYLKPTTTDLNEENAINGANQAQIAKYVKTYVRDDFSTYRMTSSNSEVGSWSNGNPIAATTRIRTKAKTEIFWKSIKLSMEPTYKLGLQLYDINGALVFDSGFQTTDGIIYPKIDNATHFTLVAAKVDNSTVTLSLLDTVNFNAKLYKSIIRQNDYIGEIINLKPAKYESFKIMDLASLSGFTYASSPQASAYYNGYMFKFINLGGVNVINLDTKTVVGSYFLPQTTDNHCANANFSTVFPSGNTVFPACYVSELYGANRCLIYSITTSSATLIQTLSMSLTVPVNQAIWILDSLSGYIYAVGYKGPTFADPSGNSVLIRKFALPSITSGNKTFVDADILASFEIPYFVIQSAVLQAGRIYMLSGFSGLSEYNMKVYDLNFNQVSKLSLVANNQEPEGIFIRDSKLYIDFYAGLLPLNEYNF